MNATQETTHDVVFSTMRFGTLSIAEDKVIYFVQGIPGFKNLRRFILIDHDSEGLFKWLQSVEDPLVAFLLTNPNVYKPDYTVPLRKSDVEGLGVKDAGNLVTLAMVCFSNNNNQVSINLKGPVLFNSENMTAMQCIIDREDYPSHFIIKI
ncbi:MAG: flagellar assembly protein FliW [Deltaproteobacteria bacterium]|nr:flagellar assembly protein FliW [Deltaproteobacteria bacterium]